MLPYSTIFGTKLSKSDMADASALTLKAYSGSWDQIAQDEGTRANPPTVYKIELTAGGLYDLLAATYNDPNNLTIYDQYGNIMLVNDEKDDPAWGLTLSDVNYKVDIIQKFLAPYSGVYYIKPGYLPGSASPFYVTEVVADLKNLSVMHAPKVGAAPTTIDWMEDKLFNYTLPTNAFTDQDANTTLTYYATMRDGSELPSWMYFDGAKGTLSGIAPTNIGIGEILIYAKDNTGLVSAPAAIEIKTPSAPPITDIAGTLTTAYTNIFRKIPTAETTGLTYLIEQVTSKAMPMQNAIWTLVYAASQTTSVATLSYQFFTGKVPGGPGMDYLLSPQGPNANNLNSAYYQNFNLENRYINFAVNLGKVGEGKDAFAATYGSLSLFEATREAYKTIFGGAPTDAKVHALIDTRVDYFASYGGDGPEGIGTKAAMAGWLLAEAVKADVGMYANANDIFLYDLADGATFAVSLVGAYGVPDFVYGG